VIGAPRAGTTSLHEAFAAHPAVAVPAIKETNFFSRNDLGLSRQEYHDLFHNDDESTALVACEISPSYLRSSQAPARIAAAATSDVKIIAVLRHPLDRLLSDIRYAYSIGVLPSPRVEDLLRASPARGEFSLAELIWKGCYSSQIGRYLEYFGPDVVRVWTFEELTNPGGSALGDIQDFVGIPRHLVEMPHANPASSPYEAMRDERRRAEMSLRRGLLSRHLWRFRAMYRGALEDDRHQVVSAGSISEICDVFARDIRGLEVTLGRSFAVWFDELARVKAQHL